MGSPGGSQNFFVEVVGDVTTHVFLLLEPAGLSRVAADVGRRYGRTAFHVPKAALLNQERMQTDADVARTQADGLAP